MSRASDATKPPDPFHAQPTVHVRTRDCEACGRTGWRQVQQAYVDRRVPPPADDLPDTERRSVEAKRFFVSRSFYPCKVCRPRTFARWVHGCYAPDHVPERCDVCGDDPSRRRR